jgi:hypothetical protein
MDTEIPTRGRSETFEEAIGRDIEPDDATPPIEAGPDRRIGDEPIGGDHATESGIAAGLFGSPEA